MPTSFLFFSHSNNKYSFHLNNKLKKAEMVCLVKINDFYFLFQQTRNAKV